MDVNPFASAVLPTQPVAKWRAISALVAQRLGLDGAVRTSLALRTTQLGLGALAIVLLPRFLSPVEQGFYYTFSSLLGLQVIFELGLTGVIVQFAAHERANLAWTHEGTLRGDPVASARLSSLLRFAVLWQGAAALIMCATLVPAGLVFFSWSPDSGFVPNWSGAWVWLVVASAGTTVITSVLAVLEGCGLIQEVADCRLRQELFSQAVFWPLLYLDYDLPAMAAMQTARLVWLTLWLLHKYRNLLADLLRPGPVGLDWRSEIWPLQWRIGASWLSGYLTVQVFNPVLFSTQGAAAAGRMGMSLALATAVTTCAMVWITTKAPLFGILIAKKRFYELDMSFKYAATQAVLVAALGATAIWFGVALLSRLGFSWSERVLSPAALAALLAASVISVLPYAQAVYLRAHKREPFLLLSILTGIAMLTTTVILSREMGANGVAFGYLAVTIALPLAGGTAIFLDARRRWHAEYL